METRLWAGMKIHAGRTLVICMVMVVICECQDIELLARPIRPEKFVSHHELQDYLQKLKTFHLQNGHRYGKRFSPKPVGKLHEKLLPENWQDIYEIVKHYQDN